MPRLANIHVGAAEKDGELVFLHKMQAGPADRSYGVHVAKLAGMPASLLTRADTILHQLEGKDVQKTTAMLKEVAPVQVETEADDSEAQLSLFSPEVVTPKEPVGKEKDVLTEILDLNLMAMTPMDVMNAVFKWQEKLK